METFIFLRPLIGDSWERKTYEELCRFAYVDAPGKLPSVHLYYLFEN